mgnify:CR=1 FL=1
MEKHNVGDLVARRDIQDGHIKLGYISRIQTIPTNDHGYYVYFFDWDKELWYQESYIDAFKEVLEIWRYENE